MTSEDAVKRLESSDNLVNIIHLPYYRGGRGKGDGERRGSKNLPESLRVVIGALGRTGNRKEIAKEFGLDYHHVYDLSKGLRGDNRYDAELDRKVSGKAEEIHDIALEKTAQMLGLVDPKGAVNLTGIELTKGQVGIAKDLSHIIKNLKPDDSKGIIDARAQVIIMSAPAKSESEYDVITVNAKKDVKKEGK